MHQVWGSLLGRDAVSEEDTCGQAAAKWARGRLVLGSVIAALSLGACL